METFTFSQTQQGREHAYRVTAHEHQYAVERDGIFIAELKCEDARWQQASGIKLSKHFIASIGDKIESYFC